MTCSFREARLVGIAIVTTALLLANVARASDPAAALEQLKQGYVLKEGGRCSDAIPHFIESHRLDPKPKALLNLADCEDRLGDLVSAQKHSVEARDLARRETDPLLAVAEEHLAALDKRLPRLTIVLSRDAPTDTAVSRDGTALGSVSLASALPANPGKHAIVASAPGHANKTFEITLAEGAQESIEVAPGEAVAPPPPPRHPVAVTPVPPPPPPPAPPRSSWTTRTTIAVSLVGVGVAGVATGSVFGVLAIGKNGDSNANDHCNATGCDATGVTLRKNALTDATVSTVAVGIGLAAAAAGVILLVTAPTNRAPSRGSLEISPSFGPKQAGIVVGHAW